ncbi:MAG: WYL domain-containing protein [Actinomycetota bacterium]|nr:WYL domain-containing protein [Actinomycetota bacterium]
MDDANPTARALQALAVLQDNPGITAELLGRKLGVSDRAARRYVAILRTADVPIDAVRGRYGGYRLGRGVRLPPLMFSATEALGLVMAVLDGHRAADAADPVGTALGKLLGALPEPVARQAEAVRRTAAAAPDRGAARPAPEVATALVQACADRRRSRLGYRSEAGSEWVADVDPWAVVVRHGRWYLLCWSHASQARRAYRVDRVTSVAVLDDVFTPPADLDPVADLEAHLAVGWEYDVDVVIDAPAETVAPCVPRALGRLSPIDAGTCQLVGSTSNPTWYAEQLTAVPASYRIVECPELRQAAGVLGERLLAASVLVGA